MFIDFGATIFKIFLTGPKHTSQAKVGATAKMHSDGDGRFTAEMCAVDCRMRKKLKVKEIRQQMACGQTFDNFIVLV